MAIYVRVLGNQYVTERDFEAAPPVIDEEKGKWLPLEDTRAAFDSRFYTAADTLVVTETTATWQRVLTARDLAQVKYSLLAQTAMENLAVVQSQYAAAMFRAVGTGTPLPEAISTAIAGIYTLETETSAAITSATSMEELALVMATT